MRQVLIGAGVLAVAIAQGQYRAEAQKPAAKRAGKPAATAQGARGAGSQTVKNLTAQQIFDYQMASTAPGTPALGRPIFEKICAKCHKFGSIGNLVGPDLSTAKSRLKKRDVLESLLWPSKVIADNYQAVVIETKDGKSYTGIVAHEDSTRVLLKTAEEPERGVVIPKANITDRMVSNKSLMPERQLNDYTEQDITNVVAFLLSTPPA